MTDKPRKRKPVEKSAPDRKDRRGLNDRRGDDPQGAGARPRAQRAPVDEDRRGVLETREISEDARRFANSVEALPPLGDVSVARLPELLLPAGSPLALEAAIEAGADAVYFGARSFSARARAENFADGEIAGALRLCRAYGVRAYAAVNTRVRDGELRDAMALVDLLFDAGVDALITADLGLCSMIRREFGASLELHASTQLTPTCAWDARALCELGFSRMVAPRELSLGQLGELCRESPIEIEAFIHGAHCVSLSGQCLMSSLIGGRSANRGECAQPCRMEYVCGKSRGALLSLSDMCYAPDIPAIISTGVRSLKVEGRQKDAAYVFGVGKIYRRLLDERRCASADEIEKLASLFERGFTDGYLRSDFRNMRGVRRDDAPSGAPFGGLRRRVAVNASLSLRSGEAPSLALTAGERTATVALDKVAQKARGEALTKERAKKQIARLGGTPFELARFDFDSDGEAWLGAAELNELRRRAAARLTEPPERGKEPLASGAALAPEAPFGAKAENTASPGGESRGEHSAIPSTGGGFAPVRVAGNARRRAAQFTSLSQIPKEAFAYFDDVYLPWSEYGAGAREAGVRLSLPAYMTDDVARRIEPLVRPGDRVLVHNAGQIAFARSLGATADLSLRLNVWNTQSALALSALTDGFVTLSPELPAAAMRDISARVGGALAVVYGKLPVMYTVRCMLRDCGKCRGGPGGVTGELRESEACRAYLADRTGARFFVLGGRDCANTIYNSVPTWTADRPVAGCGGYFVFTDESAGEVARVIAAYESGEAPKGAVRRVK